MSNSNSRLEQIEELLQQSIIVSNERMARTEQQREQDLVASRERMARIEQQREQDLAASRERMVRIEQQREQDLVASRERMARIEQQVARTEQQREQDLVASRERMARIEQIVQSNSRAIQAMLDDAAEDKLEREEFRQQITRLDDVVIRLTTVQEGVNNLLASLDSDRPTILRKLNSIETKVDRLLQDEE